ncbi:MAG: hypothetical protein ABJA79_02235 [Parafilimonas sp.]
MKRKIIYIAGYSRSGSTILDILLSSHSNIFGTGELVYLFDDWPNVSRTCSCGKIYSECDFWKNFQLPQDINFKNAIEIIRLVESRKHLTALIQNKISSPVVEQYKKIQAALYDYVFETSGKNIIGDSSKSSRDMAGRFYALHQYTGFDVYVIHLIKNGLSVMESYAKKGSNWALEKHIKKVPLLAARSSIGWLLANKIVLRLGKKLPSKKYLQIKYEDLTANPAEIFSRISAFINEDLSIVTNSILAGKTFEANHNVGGNRLRMENEIKFNVSNNDKKKINLSLKHRLVFNLIAGNLNKKFGYD